MIKLPTLKLKLLPVNSGPYVETTVIEVVYIAWSIKHQIKCIEQNKKNL